MRRGAFLVDGASDEAGIPCRGAEDRWCTPKEWLTTRGAGYADRRLLAQGFCTLCCGRGWPGLCDAGLAHGYGTRFPQSVTHTPSVLDTAVRG